MSAKRDSIITTAMRLFNQYGFTNIGIDRIIDESGVAKMTFYKHFPSKNQLIRQCLIERDRFIREQANQRLLLANTDVHSQIRALFDWYQDWFMQKDFFGCMFIKASDEFGNDSTIQTIILTHKQWLAQKIEEVLTAGNIADAITKAKQIQIALDGAIVNEHSYQNHLSISYAWQMVAPLLD